MSKPQLAYVPYQDLAGRPSIIVDGSAADGTVLTLSHWPKSPCPPGLEADLSAEMAFKYLDRLDLHGDAEAVSNNHFDQDGLVSIFALLHPEAALAHRHLLVELARAGDFARYSHRKAAQASMVLSAFADPARSPLAGSSGVDPTNYPEWASLLYNEFLPRVIEIGENPDTHRHLFDDEDASLTASEEAIASGRVTFTDEPVLDLVIVDVPEDAPRTGGHLFAGNWRKGLHPMAIHNAIDRFTVLVITGRRYELYYRYESWVQYRSAAPRPRVDLAALADELNNLETVQSTATGHAMWKADKVSGLTPALRLVDDEADSAIEPQRFIDLAIGHLAASPPAWDPYV